MKSVDVHSHFIPREFIEIVRRHPDRFQAQVITDGEGNEVLVHKQGYRYPVPPEFYDVAARRADMGRLGIDVAVLSVSPTLFYYWADVKVASEVVRLCNDAAAAMVREDPSHFRAMAAVPLQDLEATLRELERVVETLGFRAIEIGTTVEGSSLAAPELEPFWERVAALDVLVFLHPYYVGLRPGMERFYFTNLVGNPMETTLAAGELICSGHLQKFPNLNLLLAHAGGVLPYVIGRIDHGYRVREETRSAIVQPPSTYLHRLNFDTITHFSPALQYLVDNWGSERVLMGSDYPFDMADPDPRQTVAQLRVSEPERRNILGENAARLLGL